KRINARITRRKDTLISKAHDLAALGDLDVAVIVRIRRNGRIYAYDSVDLDSWPPSKEQI
ncbi:hypothetical protein BJ875DRAFT_346962, partial [Amylocarpus encephaloides]